MKRSTLYAIGTLIVLALLAWWSLQQPGEQSRSGMSANVLISVDSSAVTKLQVDGAHGSVTLEKYGDVWTITDPFRYPAEPFMATRAVSSAGNIGLKNLVSTNPEKQSLFQVDSSGTLVQVWTDQGETISFRIGKTTTSFTETYVRQEGSDDVYITDGLINSTFDKVPTDWRDKAIFAAPREAIAEVQFAYGDTSFIVARTDSAWRVDDVPIGEPTSFIASLSSFNTQAFVDSVMDSPPPLTGTITIMGISIRFHRDIETGEYFVQSSLSQQWFSIPLWNAKRLLLRRPDFLKMQQ